MLLTSRQLEIVALVARGWTNEEIGREIGLTRKTITTHLYHIAQRLGLDNRVMMAVWYVRKYECKKEKQDGV